ncbi:FAD-binding oxidoreductase [Kribbella sp. NPDC048915]|uniref:FAD-binding oxidoreductase n=1 Tax=Kribbella sp. NPDC048915 TaxID=3155148 RepID=UPI00340F75E0
MTLIGELRRRLNGPVFGPADTDFAIEIAAWNTATLHTPDIAVGLTSERDAAELVRTAAAAATPIRVLATGHGSATPVTDGILATTTRLDTVTIDAVNRIAHVGAGCCWDQVIAAAAEHGLAPITGSSDTVGCVGYTLGGGLGPLARTYGFSSDWARRFRIAIASGDVVTADATENPDLFWALRGGKGGFGIVTSMEVELVELRTIYGGSVIFDTADLAGVLTTWTEWTKTLPDAATTSVVVLRLPPLDVVPEPLRGKTALSVRFAYVGDPEQGARVFEPIRAAGTAVVDSVGVLPASEIAMIHNDPKDPGVAWDRGLLLNELDAEYVTAFLDVAGPGQEIPFVAVEMRHLGGATRRDVPEGSAVGGRDGAYTLFLAGVPDPRLFSRVLPEAADALLKPLRPWISGHNTINLAGGSPDRATYEASWPAETRARLEKVRAVYDPHALFPYGPSN